MISIRHRLLLAATLAATAIAAISVAPAGACACGAALEASVSEERALVIERPGREELILSLDLESDGTGRAAVVLPVPGDPRVEAIEGGDPLEYLDRATAALESEEAAGGSAEGVTAVPPVEVIGREVIGGYDVTRLRAADPLSLYRWLDQNGYSLPDGAEPILADYVEQGWSYVAIRLAPEASGRLRPLRVSFPTEQIVYPMRLSSLASDPVNLTLYVLADDERSAAGIETEWSGPLADLEPPPEPLRELFSAGDHLTKMVAENASPTEFDEDIVLEPAEGSGVESGADSAGEGGGDSGGGDEDLEWWAIAAILAGAMAVVLVIFRAMRGLR